MSSFHWVKVTILIFLLLLIPLFFHLQVTPPYPFTFDASARSKLQNSVTFLPLKDLRFARTPEKGNTWFMSSLNDTHKMNEAQYLYFPSEESKGRVLCIKGRDVNDGTKNSYALAWPEALPESAMLLKGLTFVSDTYYDYQNLWHGVTAVIPFVSWSIKNECLKPRRWVLFHWGEMRFKMGSWLENLTQANFGEVKVESFEGGDRPYCFEKAVVMRHNEGGMGKEKKLQASDLLRCKAREYCSVDASSRQSEINDKGEPVLRLTLLLRRGSRSFKNTSAVIEIFSRECEKVNRCRLKVVQSEDLTFCDQVRELTFTDIVASPHGAQLTNMLFMERNSSIMEFFPRGWFELAGIGQFAHHWMADQSGMIHRGSWWEPLGQKDCPSPQDDLSCFNYYKNGKVGHNETHFAEWVKTVLNQLTTSKLEDSSSQSRTQPQPDGCIC